jgi:hypothetical protein
MRARTPEVGRMIFLRKIMTLPCFVGGKPDHPACPFASPTPFFRGGGLGRYQLQPDVPPQVLHFMQVPLRTSV